MTESEKVSWLQRILPLLLNVVLLGTILFFLWQIVPRFALTFAEHGLALSWPTRVLIAFSSFVGAYLVWGILMGTLPAGIALVALFRGSRHAGVRRALLWLAGIEAVFLISALVTLWVAASSIP